MKERMKEAKEEVETEQQNKLDISSGAWYNLSVYFFISWNFKATVKRFLHREGWGWSEVLCLGCGGREQGEGEETVSQEFWTTPFSFCFTWIPPPHFWYKGYSVDGFFQFLLFVSTAQVLPNSKQDFLSPCNSTWLLTLSGTVLLTTVNNSWMTVLVSLSPNGYRPYSSVQNNAVRDGAENSHAGTNC